MKRRTVDGIIVEPTGPPLPRGRLSAKVRQALANFDATQREMQQPTITPEYRRASAALDYILKVLTPPELTAYYQAVRARRERAREARRDARGR